MKTSPCAKLISSMMPYTSVYPSAISAYRQPLVSPIRATEPNWLGPFTRFVSSHATSMANSATVSTRLAAPVTRGSPARTGRRAVCVSVAMAVLPGRSAAAADLLNQRHVGVHHLVGGELPVLPDTDGELLLADDVTGVPDREVTEDAV